MHFHSAMATLDPQNFVVARRIRTENILLVSGRLVNTFSIRSSPISKLNMVVFSRRFSSEKSPTITVASFFSFFSVRLQSHSDWATFLTIETTKTTTIRPSPVSGI